MIFADTSFWVGFINDRDDHHKAARRLWDERSVRGVVTTNQVRGETWTVLRSRAGHAVATTFLMQQLGLTEALAFDGNFSAAGFVELR